MSRGALRGVMVAMVAASALTVAACAGGGSSSASKAEAIPSDPIAQMEIAFDGHPRKAEIQVAMDRAFSALGETPTSDTYSRAGSVLVSFRKEYGVSEMKILECMPYRANDSRAPQKIFPSVAAVCLTDLASGVKVP